MKRKVRTQSAPVRQLWYSVWRPVPPKPPRALNGPHGETIYKIETIPVGQTRHYPRGSLDRYMLRNRLGVCIFARQARYGERYTSRLVAGGVDVTRVA